MRRNTVAFAAWALAMIADDGRTLYLTSSNMLARIRLNVGGATIPKP